MTFTAQSSKPVNLTLVAIGLLLSAGFGWLADLEPGKPQVTYTAAVALLMGFWWVTEAIPVGVTSLLPLVLFPVLGVMNGKTVSETYINYIIFLYIGGFVMALTMEKWHLHKRIALKILSLSGVTPFRILFGLMFAAAFLSMWISNTATAMMMMPMTLSVMSALEELYPETSWNRYFTGILLSVAYACTIGGMATLVGTPPNLSFVRIYEIMFPNGTAITFGNWFLFAFPLVVTLFIATLFYLYFLYRPKEKLPHLPVSFVKERYKALGKPSREEKVVFVVFLTLIFLWIFREPIPIGAFEIPGWGGLLASSDYINDGTVAIFIAVLLFIIPSSQKNKPLAQWDTVTKIPWHIVLLFGGGFALAKGFIDSGLSDYMGSLLADVKGFPMLAVIGIISTLTTALGEFASNTAITEMFLPIIGALAKTIQINPLLLMLPVTLAASIGFMLPVATPPNAIFYGTGKLPLRQMAATGLAINLISLVLITVFSYFWAAVVFSIPY